MQLPVEGGDLLDQQVGQREGVPVEIVLDSGEFQPGLRQRFDHMQSLNGRQIIEPVTRRASGRRRQQSRLFIVM